MKRIIALLLCVVSVMSLFAACGGNDKKSSNKGSDGPVTLTIGIPKSSMVSDYYNNYYTQWLEEKTGYKLEFQFFATGAQDYKTQLSTMIAVTVSCPIF